MTDTDPTRPCGVQWDLNRGVRCLLDQHPPGTEHSNGHVYWPDSEVFR